MKAAVSFLVATLLHWARNSPRTFPSFPQVPGLGTTQSKGWQAAICSPGLREAPLPITNKSLTSAGLARYQKEASN